MTTFGATTVQSALTAGGGHSGAKATDTTSFTVCPFEGTFHRGISLIKEHFKILVRIIIHAKSGSQYTAKNLYVKALIRLVKSPGNYARLKFLGDEAVALPPPALTPHLTHPTFPISRNLTQEKPEPHPANPPGFWGLEGSIHLQTCLKGLFLSPCRKIETWISHRQRKPIGALLATDSLYKETGVFRDYRVLIREMVRV